jgi:hypothetical protein
MTGLIFSAELLCAGRPLPVARAGNARMTAIKSARKQIQREF